MNERRSRARNRARRAAVAAVAALACAGLAAAAGAQVELPSQATDALNTATEPAPEVKKRTGQNIDTDYTPLVKESPYFSLHQGAYYRDEGDGGAESEAEYRAHREANGTGANELVTHWDDELTDVAFTNPRNGFAGGQRKIDCDGDSEPDTYVPVIYRYADSPEGLRWLRPTEAQGGMLGSCSKPGFVGAIAWFRTTGMAIAVGGDGSYPYREPAYGKDVAGNDCPTDPTVPYGGRCDQAGLGRAFLYNHGRWEELDQDDATFPNDALKPTEKWGDTLHGMTALDCSPLSTHSFCFAGGLGQIWPILVTTEGASGACLAADANGCLRFPADGVVPGLVGHPDPANGSPAYGSFDLDSGGGEGPLASEPKSTGSNDLANWALGGDTDHAFRFRFRVRQIRMDAGEGTSASTVGAIAVTAGCCSGAAEAAAAADSPYRPGDYPSVLLFSTVSSTLGRDGWRWQLRSADSDYAPTYEHGAYSAVPNDARRGLEPPNARADWPDSFYSVALRYKPLTQVTAGSRFSLLASPGGPPRAAPLERPSVVSEPLCQTPTPYEQSLELFGAFYRDQPGQLFSTLRAQLASVRLVDGDGDELAAFTQPVRMAGATPRFGPPPYAGAPSNVQRFTGVSCNQGTESRSPSEIDMSPDYRHDGVPDWSVGELRSTDRGAGARGLAFSTVSRPELVPEVVDVGWRGDEERIAGSGALPPQPDPARVLATLADPVNNPPTRQEKVVAYLQSQHFFTGSYALGAIDFLDGTGSGWAVGRHGGIVALGSASEGLASKAKVEPEPPPLGARRPGRAPERTPYEAFDPPAVEPGAVPPLATRPAERLAGHAMRSSGAPNIAPDYGGRINDLGQLIVSRDGSEGWGLDRLGGSGPTAAMTLFHYRDGAWTRCDPEGIDGVVEPDPACVELAPLRAYQVDGQLRGVTVTAAARIPNENDADATNDDELELLAIGTGTPCQPACFGGSGSAETIAPTVIRYRAGAWHPEDDREVREFLAGLGGFSVNGPNVGRFSADVELGFAGPNDGWAIGAGGSIIQQLPKLLHFDGERWIDCSTIRTVDPYNDSGVAFSDGTPPGDDKVEARKRWCDDPGQRTISAGAPPEGTAAVCSGTGQQDCDTFTGLVSAGDRLYLYGHREVGGEDPVTYPLILCKDVGGSWRAENCGLDPGFAIRKGQASSGMTGEITGLSVVVGEDGVHRGWATGSFNGGAAESATKLLRLDGSGWRPFDDEGPIEDGSSGRLGSRAVVALPDGGGLIDGVYRFEPEIGRWRAFPGSVSAGLAVPDNRGGAWLGSRSSFIDDLTHYTDAPPKPVLSEAPTPLPREEESFTALAGRANGSLWATTSDGNLYRYARTTGWDRVPIPGWRAERATVAYAAYAVDVNEQGIGVAVGREGRIAAIEGSEVRLDPAAGTLCDLTAVVPPCGTSRHLRAVAVAPDGSAIAGGEQLALLWRPSANGDFRAIDRPEATASAAITGLSMSVPGIAYLTTDQGQVFRGDLGDTGWVWRLESTDSGDNLLTRDPTSARRPAALNAVAVDAAGHGYAVGDRGAILERVNEGAHPWRLLRAGVGYELTSVVLGGEHALVGGTHGLVLAGSGGSFAIARPPDRDRGSLGVGGAKVTRSVTGSVVGLALAGGGADGQTEAWAASEGRNTGSDSNVSQLFHFASEEAAPLLDPRRSSVEPLADSPAKRRAELSFAALGKAEASEVPDLDFATLARRSVEQVAARAGHRGGPALAVFTGDATDDAGVSGVGMIDSTTKRIASTVKDNVPLTNPPGEPGGAPGARALRATRRWLAEPLALAGLGFYAAIGSQDLTSSASLPTSELVKAGLSDAWRAAFAAEPAPWGSGRRFSSERHEVRPLSRSGSSLELPEPTLDAAGDEIEVRVVSGGARTHYAFDLVDAASGRKLVRFAFADNSLKSLSASDPIQHPIELEAGEGGSGQAAWLRRVLCIKGEGSRCSREPNQPALVVANAPTYSYANPDQRFWAKDAAVFESLLLQSEATAVISGSLGWNGRYWATAPGLHEPCEGEDYRETPPAPGTVSCRGRSSSELPLGAGGIAPIANQLGSALGPAAPALDELSKQVNSVAGEGLLPFVVASGAGGALAGQGAKEGFFHGYTIVRVPGDADPAGVLVEQRPILDFLQITAASHVLRPGQKMTLKGVGRGPLVDDSGALGRPRTASFDAIDSAAVTHRYDLVEADPLKPWLPRTVGAGQDPSTPGSQSDPSAQDDKTGASAQDGGGGYVPLDPSIATIDPISGVIKVGRGNNPRTFALGVLSVGCSGTQADADGTCDPSDPGVKVATFPLLFESRRTFKPVVPPASPVAQIRAQAQAVLPQPPNPPLPPNVQSPPLPPPPNVPLPPPIDIPEVNVPSPPIPPPPPVGQSPVPLDLSASAPTLQIAPQTTVIPPPAPPIQPAPPGGARREARQRQSATQSSGSGSGAAGSEGQEIDLVQSKDDPNAFTRHDRVQPGHSFTPVARADQPSAWARGALYGGGVALMALTLAIGFNHGRPGPRRRPPTVPAPAWSRFQRRR